MKDLVSRAVAILSIGMALCFMCSRTLADSPAPPKDYKQVTENKEYVFVMLASDEWGNSSSKAEEAYKQSGLYKNDGSTEPLWTVDWYSFQVFPSSDGKHLVRMGPWASSMQDMALSFYEDGKEIKTYKIQDLVRDESKLSHTVSHFFWRSKVEYDDKQGILLLETEEGQNYRFSVQTGEILK